MAARPWSDPESHRVVTLFVYIDIEVLGVGHRTLSRTRKGAVSDPASSTIELQKCNAQDHPIGTPSKHAKTNVSLLTST